MKKEPVKNETVRKETSAETSEELATATGTDTEPSHDEWFRGWWWPDLAPPRWARMIESRFPDFFDFGRRGEMMMRVEELEDDGHKVVRAELPGVDPDDIDIRIEQGRLFIRAEREEKKEDRDDTRIRSEFRYGSYERSFALPAGASEDDVKATYADGILEVRVPVDTAVSEARKIPIAHH